MSINKCTELLDELKKTSLRFGPKTSDIVEKARQLALEFKALPPSERDFIKEELDSSVSHKLLSLSSYLAEFAINTKQSSWINTAITLHIIEDFRSDYRNNFRYLVLVAYAANKLGTNFSSIVDDILALASTRTKNYLHDFVGRDDSLNSLSSMGVKAAKVEGKVTFIPIKIKGR